MLLDCGEKQFYECHTPSLVIVIEAVICENRITLRLFPFACVLQFCLLWQADIQ